MSETERKQALAKHLECDVEDLEEGSDWYGFTSFEVNPRKEKQGKPPSYYIKTIKLYKSLLMDSWKDHIADYLNSTELPIYLTEVRNKLYKNLKQHLSRDSETGAYKWLDSNWLYVENVTYHLLDKNPDYNKESHQKLVKAWFDEPIEDDREFSQVDDGEYLVLTDEEADEACTEYIKTSVWAFNASFVIDHSDLPYDAWEMVQSYQEDRCEGANETILAMINDFDTFVEDAISADGRGHFLSPYDGEEYEQGDYYIYRLN